MIREHITIINKLGLHARAAAKLVSTASMFSSTIQVGKDAQQLVDAKSIMSVMMLAASKGTDLVIVCEGADEQQAMTAIRELIADRFEEDE